MCNRPRPRGYSYANFDSDANAVVRNVPRKQGYAVSNCTSDYRYVRGRIQPHADCHSDSGAYRDGDSGSYIYAEPNLDA